MLCLRKILIFSMVAGITCSLWASAPLCISLGDACAPAIHLRNFGLRREAYPFDWIVSPFSSLYAALQDDFKFFLTNLQMRPGGDGVSDHYGFNFTHDWPTIHQPHIDALNADYVPNCPLFIEWERALPLVREKYRRRIERFKDACQGNQKIFFIINSLTTREQATLLRNFFRNKYTTLDFVILVFSPDPAANHSWNIDGIKNFYVPRWDDSGLWSATLKKVDPVFNILRRSESFIHDLDCAECRQNF